MSEKKPFNTKATFYCVACASLVINYFTAPIAAPVIWDSVKSHTAAHLMEMASSLHPQEPTYIPPVQQAALEKAENGKPSTMPDKLPISKIATAYPAGNSDIIRELLEKN